MFAFRRSKTHYLRVMHLRDARVSSGVPLGTVLGVAALAAAAAVVALVVEYFTLPGAPLLSRWTIVLLAIASGLFVAAGVLRLAKWRLVHDSHSALVGTALIVMGGLCLPLGGLARVVVTTGDLSIVGPATRCLASYIAMLLVLRALRANEVSHRSRPGHLLPRLAVVVILAFWLLLAGEGLIPPDVGVALRGVILPVALCLGWIWVAAQAARRGKTLPWASRAAPLFLGMGLAEMMRGFDVGRFEAWTLGGVLLCAFMAALATRSALLDLDAAVRADGHQVNDLSQALQRVSHEADELMVWREQLTHDARNACAGLRAAMDILERYDGRVDSRTTESLRLAAVQEIGHLEHLLFRSSSAPCQVFEVAAVVSAVGESARALGARVTVSGDEVHGIGRADDLSAVLRNLLVNAQTHAPGSRVQIGVAADADTVTITCSDDGPGLTAADADRVFDRGYRGAASPGSGLGLYAARELMREQGGDITLAPSPFGATFLLTLPAAPLVERLTPPIRVPAQAAAITSPSGPYLLSRS